MKQKLFLLASLLFVQNNMAVSFIKEIYNDTQFVFEIVDHSSESLCSLFTGDIQLYRVHPQETLRNLIIMQKGDTLILRPVAYFDKRQQEFIWLIDKNGNSQEEGIKNAYQAWKYDESINRRKISKKARTQENWIKKWVGGDLLVTIKKELYGYMLHVMHAASANNSHIDHAWPIYSQGVYSALGLTINLTQDSRKGIVPTIEEIQNFIQSFLNQQEAS